MDPEEAMHRLAAGEVDAAFIWGPSAGYINHAVLRDKFDVIADRRTADAMAGSDRLLEQAGGIAR